MQNEYSPLVNLSLASEELATLIECGELSGGDILELPSDLVDGIISLDNN